ncbi:PREDICTED: RNA polymerase II degradation factor 1 [Ceratosolen solmsi marchali]|uniref:RNA polymerase II degradation factor 1 n=1 Tax=Ceratosolen solmsi marchali TaxID=326594 RepID=A0AAJ7DXR3_9HYME|nr:PREDICTED: RNA polymerase II degradation factor 1 [Ceratosolen solmsi marchali]
MPELRRGTKSNRSTTINDKESRSCFTGPTATTSTTTTTTTTATTTTAATSEVAAGAGLQPYAAAAGGEVVAVDEVKMEAEEHLAREYVQEFVLDHLDPGDVKREAAAAAAAAASAAALAADKLRTPSKPLLGHEPAQLRSLGSPPGTGPGALGPLTPPAHELEQPPYGQPQLQHVVQAGVLLKLPYGPGLTGLSHPGTPPDTPPVSASPPALHHLQRLDRLERAQYQPHLQQQQQSQHPHQHQQHQQQQQQHLRQEPLDLRPHCPPEPGPEADMDAEHWPGHHLPDLVQHHHHSIHHQGGHPARLSRHTGQFKAPNSGGYIMGGHIEYYTSGGAGGGGGSGGGGAGGGGGGINGAGGMMPVQLDDGMQMQIQQQQQQQQQQQPGRPLSVCSGSSCGPGPGSSQGPGGPSPVHTIRIHRSASITHCSGPAGSHEHCSEPPGSHDDLMNDELLMSLSVRELNKRLQGCPREEFLFYANECETNH